LSEVVDLWKPDVRCEPQLGSEARERELAGWREAVKRVRTC
jgi:glycerol kinase